eukprot:213604-Chlamydomonas_euryale.AAC.17
MDPCHLRLCVLVHYEACLVLARLLSGEDELPVRLTIGCMKNLPSWGLDLYGRCSRTCMPMRQAQVMQIVLKKVCMTQLTRTSIGMGAVGLSLWKALYVPTTITLELISCAGSHVSDFRLRIFFAVLDIRCWIHPTS